MVDQMK